MRPNSPIARLALRAIKVTRWASLALATIGAAACILMSIQVFFDVGLRVLTGAPLSGTLDFVTYLWMPVLVFSGFAIAEMRREHITMDLVTQGLEGKTSKIAGLIARALSIFIMGILVYYSLQAALDSVAIRQSTFGSIHMPVWPTKIYMVVGLSIMTLQLLANAYSDLMRPTSTSDGSFTVAAQKDAI